jgi:dipeptidyl-peptidase-4
MIRSPRLSAAFAASRAARSMVTALLAASVSAGIAAGAAAQTYTPIKELPGNELMRRMESAMGGIGGGGDIGEVKWDAAARRLWFQKDGWKTVDLATGAVAAEAGNPPESALASSTQREARERRPARGRQFTTAESPDGAWTAVSENGNLFLRPKEGDQVAVTTDGTADIKYGQASWVYGEELDQTTAMWWSPDSRFLAFYRFDESQVKDFFILGGWTEVNTRVLSEAYPKPGQPNPTATLMVHELATGRTVAVDSFSERSGAVAGTEYYLYNVRWTPDGRELLYSRTPRRQDVLDVLAADPATGASRLVVQERQDTWQANAPGMRFLKDGTRFIWETEKTGYRHYELRSLDGSLIATLTRGDWPVERIVLLDEESGRLWFTAWSGPVAVRQQLHVARLDGGGASRVTGDDFHHLGFRISPDGAFVVATAQTTQVPPRTVVYSAEGKLVATLAEGDAKGFRTHGLTPSELFTCKAADGKTELYGKIKFPPGFDPARKYPVVVDTYGGPTVRLVTDTFDAGDARSALGFILVTVDNRGTPGRGKAFESAAYLNLGVTDADDQAAAVQHLAATRPYVDAARVGITGHSYGGFMTAICLIRRGDVFAAGVAGAPPTDWRQYDTIYTERYMRTPQENPAGYDAGSCVKQAAKLRGKLMLLHGMMDDNVHPNNTFELAHALQALNRPFSMMLFPNSDHGIRSPAAESVKWSFFVEALSAEPPAWGAAPVSSQGGAPAEAEAAR